MIDILVISQASFLGINREVYRRLLNNNYNIEIVAPRKLKYPSGTKTAEAQSSEDPKIHYLELLGTNPRTYRYSGLKKLLNKIKPKIVFIDNDPGSLLSVFLSNWSKKNNSFLRLV